MNVKKDIGLTESQDYYKHIFWCPNCGDRNPRFIKKGITIGGVSFNCDKCGCLIEGKKVWKG